MKVFVRVVDAASFVRAAETLQLPAASVSRMVQALEAHLHVKLLNRSTRTVALTNEGRTYYERCVQVLSEIDDMEATVMGASQRPRGRVKISLPGSMAKAVLIPALPDFLARFPQVDIEMAISDRTVNLIEDGMDCAVRVGLTVEPGLVAKRIGEASRITCASPAYLERHGEPRTVAELAAHVGVGYIWNDGARSRPWDFMVDGAVQHFRIAHAVYVNDADAYLACAVAGLGIVRASDYTLRPAVRNGQLVEILRPFCAVPRPVSIVYQPNRHMPQSLRAFINWYHGVFQAVGLAV